MTTPLQQFTEVLDSLNLRPEQYRRVYNAALALTGENEPKTVMQMQNPDCPVHGCYVSGEQHKVKVQVFGEVEQQIYKIPFTGNSEQFKVIDDWSKEMEAASDKYASVTAAIQGHNVVVSEDKGVLIVEPVKTDK